MADKAQTPWSAAEKADAETMWRAGMSARDIANHVGRTRNSVLGMMDRNRARFPLVKLPGIRKAKVGTQERKKAANEWTGAEIGTAALMWIKGATAAEIAAAIGRSASAVYSYTREHPRQFSPRTKVRAFAPGPLLTQKTEPPPAAPDCRPVTLVERRANQCHFPLWENYGAKPTAESLYCGGAVDGGSDYCAFHHQLMYRPKAAVVVSKKRRAA